MTAFGDELRCFLAKRGMTLGELARRSSFDKGYLSKVVNGHKPGSSYLAARLDEVLDADGTLIALAAPIPSAVLDTDERERLAWARRNPRLIDETTINSLARVLAAQRRAEDTLGAAAILPSVLAQLALVEELVTEARGPARCPLVDVAGQWAQFAGWLHASARHDEAAACMHDRALEWAVEAGDINLISQVISMKGHLAWMAGHPGPVIGLSQAAQRDPGAFPGQHAISAVQEARGHAMTGDADKAERKLADAMTKAQEATGHQGEAPPWLYYHSPAFFEVQRGIVFGYFADVPRYHDLALTALEAGYAEMSPEEQRSEWGAGYLVHAAAVHERGGNVEQATAIALDVARIVRQTNAARLRALLIPVHTRLAARWPHEPRVTELADVLR